MRSRRKFRPEPLIRKWAERGVLSRGLVCKEEATWFGVRACHEIWSKKEEAHWEARLQKTVAELMELCRDLPNQARLRGRCLELNCDQES